MKEYTKVFVDGMKFGIMTTLEQMQKTLNDVFDTYRQIIPKELEQKIEEMEEKKNE